MHKLKTYVSKSIMYGNDNFSSWLLIPSRLDMYLPSSETERYGMTNGSCPLVFCLQKSCRGFEHSYHVAKALSGSVQFRTSVNGAQRRSLKKAALLKCLKDRNDMYGWVLGSHFGSLIDLEQEMGQWSHVQVRYTDLGDYVWVVYIWSIRVADVCVILVGDFTSWVKSSSVIVESQEECGFSK